MIVVLPTSLVTEQQFKVQKLLEAYNFLQAVGLTIMCVENNCNGEGKYDYFILEPPHDQPETWREARSAKLSHFRGKSWFKGGNFSMVTLSGGHNFFKLHGITLASLSGDSGHTGY